MEKLQIAYPILGEGKYDRLALLSVVEAQVLTTEGFGIFKKKEKLALLRALAKKTPIIGLTDPDGAGKGIRAHVTSALPKDRIIPLYVPQIKGKESRKQAPSAAGFLGVEGQERDLLYRLLEPFATDVPVGADNPLSKVDFFEDGLTGTADCAARRAALAAAFELPTDMTPNALLAALRVVATYEEYKTTVRRLFENEKK